MTAKELIEMTVKHTVSELKRAVTFVLARFLFYRKVNGISAET